MLTFRRCWRSADGTFVAQQVRLAVDPKRLRDTMKNEALRAGRLAGLFFVLKPEGFDRLDRKAVY